MTLDEGPSPEDLRRFGDDTGYCPSCGEEVSDLADVCPHCGAFMSGGPARRTPVEQDFHRKWIILVVAAAIVGLILLLI